MFRDSSAVEQEAVLAALDGNVKMNKWVNSGNVSTTLSQALSAKKKGKVQRLGEYTN